MSERTCATIGLAQLSPMGRPIEGRQDSPLGERQGELPPAWPARGQSAAASQWYVIQAKPRQEARVVRHLALAALSSFLPFIEVTRRRRSARTTCLEPLFPGYLFIRLAPLHRDPGMWNTVRWTPGVSRILTVGATPVPVPEEFVAEIEKRTSEHGFVRLASPLVNGARVRVCSGPFQDLEAVFDRPLSRAGRVRVLLQLMGQPTSVEIDEDELEPA